MSVIAEMAAEARSQESDPAAGQSPLPTTGPAAGLRANVFISNGRIASITPGSKGFGHFAVGRGADDYSSHRLSSTDIRAIAALLIAFADNEDRYL